MNILQKTYLNDLEIRYDSSHNIEDIKIIINNNYNLFASYLKNCKIISLVPCDDENVLYIDNFNAFFINLVKSQYQNSDTIKAITNPDFLIALYINHLAILNPDNVITLPAIQEELLFSLIAYKYYCENMNNFAEFVKFLKYRQNKELLITWLKNECRFEAYNYILQGIINSLKANDFEFLDSLNQIMGTFLTTATINAMNLNHNEEVNYNTISLQQLDSLFIEFLEYINAPKEYLKIYQGLKVKGKIKYEPETNDIDNSMCYQENDGSYSILITTNGTLRDLINLIHEFIHYISFQSVREKSAIKFSLIEFPSIYFEFVATEFLKQKGFNASEVDSLIIDRKNNDILTFSRLSPLFKDIASYIKDGKITRERKIIEYKNAIEQLNSTKQTILQSSDSKSAQYFLDFVEKVSSNIETKVDESIDNQTINYMQEGMLILNGYQYLLGTLLADALYQKSITDDNILPRILMVVSNLANYDLNTLIAEFNLEHAFSEMKK